MANPEHLKILNKGVEAWNAWRRVCQGQPDLSGANLSVNLSLSRSWNDRSRADPREADLHEADLSGADLHGADLSRADLIGADLHEADLSGADLHVADLCGADLHGADLSRADLGVATLPDTDLRGADLHGADLCGASFIGANLREANLRGADFDGTDLSGASLFGTDFSYASIGYAVFGDVDLSEAKGLLTCKHVGPSTIGIDTIYRSKGKIPEEFLRGAGVPDNFITYMKSLTVAVEFYSCFISYSSADQVFAERLHADLRAQGVRCWFARHDMQSGKKVHEQIDEAIRVHEKLLLILSPASIKSEWVKTEIAKARKRELRENRRMLFPVRLVDFETLRDWEAFDADTGKDMACEIREYFIPDFSQWKDHDSYEQTFAPLLRDLQTAAI